MKAKSHCRCQFKVLCVLRIHLISSPTSCSSVSKTSVFFIWGSLGSNMNLGTSYPKWHFSYFCKVGRGKCHVTQIRSRWLPTKSFPVHYSLRIPPPLHKVVQKSRNTGRNKLNFRVTSVPPCIIWATNSNKVKIKFTLEQARKAQSGNNVQLYYLLYIMVQPMHLFVLKH
jgi:hypothetical protein